jgi:hypothetical protein
MSLQTLDNQINTLRNQINECEGSMVEFNAAINRYIDLLKNYETNHANWTQRVTARQTWETERNQFIEAGRVLPSNMVWHDNKKVNCGTVQKATLSGTILTRNCNDVPNTPASKCTACGHWKCDCTLGLDSWCKRSNCDSYQVISADLFRNTSYYTEWLRLNPEPVLPGPEPGKPPEFPISVNMVCTTCTQNVVIKDINSSAGSVQFKKNALSQSQNCVANLNYQKSSLETEKAKLAEALAEEARRAAEEAAARNAASVAAAAEAERLAAQRAADEAAAAAQASLEAAQRQKTAEELAESQKARFAAAKAAEEQFQMIIFVFIFFIFVALLIGAYVIYKENNKPPIGY